MPLNSPLHEIVLFAPDAAPNGNGSRLVRGLGLRPIMLCEAVLRGLESLEAGGRPVLVVRGVTHTDPDIFRALRARDDFKV